jgi:hypothetical protein
MVGRQKQRRGNLAAGLKRKNIMRAYQNSRFIEGPDVADIREQGRASHVGKLPERCGVFKPYFRNAEARRATRRSLKRADKNKTSRLERQWDDA